MMKFLYKKNGIIELNISIPLFNRISKYPEQGIMTYVISIVFC